LRRRKEERFIQFLQGSKRIGHEPNVVVGEVKRFLILLQIGGPTNIESQKEYEIGFVDV